MSWDLAARARSCSAFSRELQTSRILDVEVNRGIPSLASSEPPSRAPLAHNPSYYMKNHPIQQPYSLEVILRLGLCPPFFEELCFAKPLPRNPSPSSRSARRDHPNEHSLREMRRFCGSFPFRNPQGPQGSYVRPVFRQRRVLFSESPGIPDSRVAPIACLSGRRSRKRVVGSWQNASCACGTPIAELSVLLAYVGNCSF
jgi:hypothetical protein